MKKTFLLFFLIIVSNRLFAQGSNVNADPFTGALNVNIPVCEISNGNVSIPIQLVYSSNGIRPKDVEQTSGIGWQLNTGGQIRRTLRGLPDDVSQDSYLNARIGWMKSSNTAAAAIAGFAIQNDGATCSKETTDISNINSSFPFNYDTEPDIFSVSAPGLSCQLIYNRATSKFVPVNGDRLNVSYTTDANGLINSFTIVNEQGTKYVFAAIEYARIYTTGTNPSYFKTTYNQYLFFVSFYSGWGLTSLTDINGNGLNLTYDVGNGNYTQTGTDVVALVLPGATTSTEQYKVTRAIIPALLTSISSTNPNDLSSSLSFTWDKFSSGMNGISQVAGMGKNFSFNYISVYYGTNPHPKSFLRSFVDNGCSTPVNYQFSYGGESLTNGTYKTLLPDSAAAQIDYWGFANYSTNLYLIPQVWINPSNTSLPRYAVYSTGTGGGSYAYASSNGFNRSATTTNLNAGNLISIKYAAGGTTSILYEQNSYVDKPSNTMVNGAGIRVKQITDFDGFNTAKNIIRNYTYNDPATGLTSGQPISMPSFAFTIPYSGALTGSNLWNANTVLSENDLSDEDHSIIYAYSKVSTSGAGSTQFQFYIPATTWDNNASPDCAGCATEWVPTTNYSARNSCASTYGPVINSTRAYPFIPNPNYDFERGLIKSAIEYNDAGSKVSEQTYSYQRSFIPSAITAFKWEDNVNGSLLVKAYNKYKIYFNTTELKTSIIKKIYDSSGLNQAQTSQVNYVYGSANHKLLTQQSSVNSDGSTINTFYKYVKDYAASSTTINPYVDAIYNMQQQNLNILVESWQQVVRSGSTSTTNASLVLFKGFSLGGANHYLPSQELKLVQPNGAASFAPFSIIGTSSTYDAKYFPVKNFTSYDDFGYLQTADDANKHFTTSIADHAVNAPVAIFKNAAYGEIGFSNFDANSVSNPNYNFTISGSGSFASNGSHTGNGYGLAVGQTITKTITVKNTASSNYVFSIWINAAVAGGNLSFTLTGGNTFSTSKAFNIGGWTYYSWKLPVTNMSSSFTISITSSQPISIDDLLFYPEVSQVTTAAYDKTTQFKTAETNSNGVSKYFLSDQWGRLLYKFDQDKNILERTSYFTPDQITQGLLTPTISTLPTSYVLTSVNFSATPTPCLSGTIYSWTFGDGSSVTGQTSNATSHTFSTTGSFPVTVTASNALYGTKSSTVNINIIPPPLTPVICASGVQKWNDCTNSAVTTVTCGTNPTSSRISYYTVNSVGGTGYGTLSYQWQISLNGGTTWTDYTDQINTSQIDIDCNRESYSYKVRCLVTSTAGQQGMSNILSFVALPPC